MPDTQVRVVGSGFSTFSYQGQPIAFLEGVDDSGQRAFSDAGQGYQFIHPLGQSHPIEIATSRVLAGGTLNLTIRELWNGWVWEQLQGLAGTNNIVDVFRVLAANPSYVTCQTVIQPPGNARPRGKNYMNCFSGETRYLTKDGTKTLAETVGTTQMVMSSRGWWTPAEIQSFGAQELYSITLTRQGRKKVIQATAGHRWFKEGRRPQKCYATELVTTELQAGDRLVSVFQPNQTSKIRPSAIGIQAGIVYGDGNIEGKAQNAACVDLWGEKDAQLLKWFPLSPTRQVESAGGVAGTRVVDLPGYFKARPSLGESMSYLYGWLAGYFAADGQVLKQGSAILASNDRDGLEFTRDVCTLLGIRTTGITSKEKRGFGDFTGYELNLYVPDLTEDFFLIADHRLRALPRLHQEDPKPFGAWKVESVKQTGFTDEVYCALVPEGHAFVLEDNILTGNCTIVDISDNDTITVGALAVTKGIVVAYTHSTAV